MSPSKWAVTAISLILMFGNGLFPNIPGMTDVGTSVVCIFVGTILMLLFVDLQWPCLLCVLAFATTGIYSLSDAIATAFGHNLFWLIVLSGMVLGVLEDTGIIRRVAISIITCKLSRKGPWFFVSLLMFASMFIGFFIDSSCCMILMLALTSEILKSLEIKQGNRTAALIVMGVFLMVSIAYGATPFGHSSPVALLGMYEEAGFNVLSFATYCIPGVISAVIFLALMLVYFKVALKLDVAPLCSYDADALRSSLGPISRAEIVSGLTYVAVILVWLLPNIIGGVLPGVADFINTLGVNAPLIVAIVFLCLYRVDGKPLFDFQHRLVTAPWVPAILVGVNMLLAAAVQLPEAGFTDFFVNNIGPALGGIHPMLFVLVMCGGTILMTQFCSNMLSAVVFTTIAIPMMSSGVITGVEGGALCFAIAIGANVAYCMPTASTLAAFTYTSGWVTPKMQASVGAFGAIMGALVISFIGYNLAALVL